jgi:ribosome assembly protein YihI (activator of Der GTPase)
MTRIKKSRTSGPIGSRHKPAAEARQTRERPVETKKKGSGLKSGSRNNPLQEKSPHTGPANKDPRHGSKKPIALQVNEAEQKLLQQTPDFKPKAQLAKVKVAALPPEQELAQLEQDEQLLALVERVENGEILTGKDAKYFNAKTARHAELLSVLGLDEEDEQEDESVDAEEDLDPLAQFERTDWRKDLLGE